MPTLDLVIAAFECYDNPNKSPCDNCSYGYGYLDEHWDYPCWSCDIEKLENDMLGYLKIYQYLVQEQENNNNGQNVKN